jgi:hypothetical protein
MPGKERPWVAPSRRSTPPSFCIPHTQSIRASLDGYRRLPLRLDLSEVWVSAEAATLFTVLEAFGFLNIPPALLATDFEVFSFFAISHFHSRVHLLSGESRGPGSDRAGSLAARPASYFS